MKALLLITAVLFFGFDIAFFDIAYAACTSPAGVAGQFQYITSDFKVCNGTIWKTMSAAAPSGSCSTAGRLELSGSIVRFCNGTNFVSLDGPQTNGSCAGTTTGTIRYSAANQWMEWCNGTNWKVMGPPAPTVTSLSVIAAQDDGGVTTRLTGTNFLAGAVAKVNNVNCTTTTFVSATQVDCVVPAGAGGAIAQVDVSVTNPDTQVGTLTGGFFYLGDIGIWFKSDDGPTVVSGKVTAWADRSGAGRNASEWASSANPTYIASSPSFGGKPVVFFNGAHVFDVNAYTLPSGTEEMSFIYAARRTTTTGFGNIMTFQNVANNDVRYAVGVGDPGVTNVGSSPSGDVVFRGRRAAANAENLIRGGSVGTSPFIAVSVIDHLARAANLFVNGVQVSTSSTFSTAGVSPTGSSSNVSLGGDDGYSYFTGELAEILVYRDGLTLSDRTALENYLRARYGI